MKRNTKTDLRVLRVEVSKAMSRLKDTNGKTTPTLAMRGGLMAVIDISRRDDVTGMLYSKYKKLLLEYGVDHNTISDLCTRLDRPNQQVVFLEEMKPHCQTCTCYIHMV